LSESAQPEQAGAATVPVPAPAPQNLYRRLRHQLVTPELIYGTIIVSAIIVLADDDQSDFSLLSVVAVTTFVFWIAHVFAATVAHHGKRGGKEVPLGEALGNAVRHSSGVLLAAVIPVFVLALGAAGILSEDGAYLVALLLGVVVLFVLGVLAFAERGSRWYFCLLGGLSTGGLGVVVILLKAIFH
jgi:hypothetical protein